MRPPRAVRPLLVLSLAVAAALALGSCSEGGGGGVTEPSPTIAVALGAATLELTQGQNNTVTVSVTRGGGYDGAVDLLVEGAPAGVTGTFAPASLTGSATSSTLTLAAAADAAVGASELVIRARAQGVEEKTATAALTVLPMPAYTLTLDPPSLSVAQGQSGTAQIQLARTSFPGAVGLSVSGIPEGVIASVSPASVTDDAATLTVNVGSGAALGTYTLTVTGQAEGLGHRTATLQLTVRDLGDYTLGISPASLTVAQGQSGTATVTATASGDFDGEIALSLAGAPAGVTASLSPTTIRPSSRVRRASTGPTSSTPTSSTLTVEVGGATAPGTYTLTVTGRAEGLPERTATLELTVAAVPPDFNLSLTPTSLSAIPGETVSATVNVTRSGPFDGAVALSVTGAPEDATASVSPATVTGGSATLTVQVGASTAPGSYTLTLTGRAEGLDDRTATLRLTVRPPPSITLAVQPAVLDLPRETSSTVTVTVTRTNYSGPIQLALEDAPRGVTGSFDPATITSGTRSTLTLAAAADAVTGTTELVIRASGEGIEEKTAVVALTVHAAPPVTLALEPASLTLRRDQTGTVQIRLTRNDFTGPVALSVSGVPGGVTAGISPASTTGDAATLTLNPSGARVSGSSTLTITGRVGGFPDQTATLSLTILPDYSLSVTPAELTVVRGRTGTAGVSVEPVGRGDTGTVSLSVAGAPAGVTASVSPTSVRFGGMVRGARQDPPTLTIEVGAQAALGSSALTITGRMEGIEDRTATLQLTVVPYEIVLDPTSLTVAAGENGTIAIQIQRGSFTGPVTLSVTGMPSGVTASISPTTVTSDPATLTVNVASGAAEGVYSLTVTGKVQGFDDRTSTLELRIGGAGRR